MATPAAPNPISFSQIQTEFGGSNPISLSEYYKAEVGTPITGNPISANDLRGKTRQGSTAECAAAIKASLITTGVFDTPTTVGPLCNQKRANASSEMGTPIFTFTPSALTSVNVKNCVNNTVVWYTCGDGLSSRGMSAFKINGGAVTPTFSCSTNLNIGTGGNAQSIIDANIYSMQYGATARVTTITSASCTFPSKGPDGQVIGGAFLLPGRWDATVITGNATALVPGSITTPPLLVNDVVVMNYIITVDPDQTPNSIGGLNMVSGTTQLAAHYNYITKWHGISGIAVYTCAVAGTYTLPVTTTTYGNEPLYKQAVRFRFVPEYVGQA